MTDKLTHKDFLKTFASKNIDVNRVSVQDNPFKLFDVFGTHYTATTYEGFKYNLEKLSGKDLSSWSFEEPCWVKFSDKVAEVVEVVEVVTTLEEVKEVVTEGEISLTENKVDWEWVQSLKNKKYDKEDLDKYAESKFGIKLNRRNTIENMIEDFKFQLEAQ